MTILDIIFLVPLAIFMIKGFRRGAIIELASLIALIFAVIGCLKLTHHVLVRITGPQAGSEWLPFVVYLVVFCVIYLLIYLLGRLLEKIVKTANLDFVNKFAGLALGIFKAVFLFSLLIWLLNMVDVFPEEMKEKSIAYRYIKPVAPVIIDMISSLIPVFRDIITQIESFFDKMVK